MGPLSKRNFAFIVNAESFPSAYLVEMSRRKEKKEEERAFYRPNVIFMPPKMNFIFKSILDNGPLFKIYQVIKETMLEAIENNNKEFLANGSILPAQLYAQNAE
jgi:hypothetical protein